MVLFLVVFALFSVHCSVHLLLVLLLFNRHAHVLQMKNTTNKIATNECCDAIDVAHTFLTISFLLLALFVRPIAISVHAAAAS